MRLASTRAHHWRKVLQEFFDLGRREEKAHRVHNSEHYPARGSGASSSFEVRVHRARTWIWNHQQRLVILRFYEYIGSGIFITIRHEDLYKSHCLFTTPQRAAVNRVRRVAYFPIQDEPANPKYGANANTKHIGEVLSHEGANSCRGYRTAAVSSFTKGAN